MNKKSFFKNVALVLFFGCFLSLSLAHAESNTIDAKKLTPRVEVFMSPRTGSFVEGSTFDVPVFINTNGASIQSIEIRVHYDKDKLAIIQPTGGVSIVGVWTESPSYDNLLGVASYIGSIPGGLITQSGLVGKITFKAIGPGVASIGVHASSKVVLDDNLGTNAVLDLGRSDYTILKKVGEGVRIFSETNPSEGQWYKNNSPVFSWDRDPGVTGFSFVLDDKPTTIPENVILTNETTKGYESLQDGLWYFHVKANKNGAWSTTGHFLVKIDTVPPATFVPQSNYLLAATLVTGRTLISFFTIDNLSGVDHYEVGTIDQNQPISQSPVFIESSSPFQAPLIKGSSMKVIVRAVDKAGNIRDSSIDIKPPFVVSGFLRDKALYIFLVLALIILYYLNKYHVINPFKRLTNFNALESDIKSFVDKQKEINKNNLLEQEKIKELKKELEEAEVQVSNEIKSHE